MKRTAVVCWLSTLSLCMPTSVSAAETNTQARTISVSGTAVGYAPADIVRWTVAMETTQKDLVEAKKAGDAQLKVLLELMQQRQIPPSDIDIGLIKIKDAVPGVYTQGTTVTRTLTVRQRGVAGFSDMLQALSTAVRGTLRYTFESSKLPEVTRDTMTRAVAAAKDKATALAQTLDAKLGPVLTISEYSPANWTVRDDQVQVDVPTEAFGADAKTISQTLFVTFALQ